MLSQDDGRIADIETMPDNTPIFRFFATLNVMKNQKITILNAFLTDAGLRTGNGNPFPLIGNRIIRNNADPYMDQDDSLSNAHHSLKFGIQILTFNPDPYMDQSEKPINGRHLQRNDREKVVSNPDPYMDRFFAVFNDRLTINKDQRRQQLFDKTPQIWQ